MFVIEQPLLVAPAANFETQVLLEWNAVYDAHNEVACLILGSMTAELHIQFENSSPYDMIKELKAMFEKQAGVESMTAELHIQFENSSPYDMIKELKAMFEKQAGVE
nr:hypothetical protein [Tanacetum cinerariifolium]